MIKILNFALKIKEGGREGGTCDVLQPCHHPPKKIETRTRPNSCCQQNFKCFDMPLLSLGLFHERVAMTVKQI